MAITRHTQKDVGRYEAKLIGPLTAPQAITIAPGLVIAVFLGMILNSFQLDAMTIFILCGTVIIPFVVWAKARPCGMKPKDFIKMYYKYHICAPRKRLYKTETFDDIVFNALGNISEIKTDQKNENQTQTKTKKSKKVCKQNPQYPSYF